MNFLIDIIGTIVGVTFALIGLAFFTDWIARISFH